MVSGTMTFKDGSKFVGTFKNWHPVNGTLSLKNGASYQGDFGQNGRMDGQGTLTTAEGDRYIGAFKDGKQEGQGTYYPHDGSHPTTQAWHQGAPSSGPPPPSMSPAPYSFTITVGSPGGDDPNIATSMSGW
jgi:hypothetical protein